MALIKRPKTSKQIIINGVELPSPAPNFEIVRSVVVDSGRNVNGTVVGQVIGRPLWKLNNLQWNGLNEDDWVKIKSIFAKDFYVKVTFVGDDQEVHNITMYPSDMAGNPVFFDEITRKYRLYKYCKFNLIDCGKPNER